MRLLHCLAQRPYNDDEDGHFRFRNVETDAERAKGTGLGAHRLQSLWHVRSGAQVPSLWYKGSAAPWHVEFFQARIEPVFPALAGRLPTSGPPGKS